MKEVIRLENVCRSFMMGKVEVNALCGIDMIINMGEFVAMMGASGSGKTTLLNQIGLLDIPTSGEVYVNGANTTTLDEETRCEFRLNHIGFVFQFFNLFNELSALENVLVPSMLAGNRSIQSKQRAVSLLTQVGLEQRLDHYPSELSGGQQQRVAIARALMNDPPILLTDEPTANLDSSTSKGIVDLFRQLNQEFGKTVIMVTHEEVLGKIADRVVRLRDGVVDGV